MANMLNCALGELPMEYLGIPVSDQHLAMGPLIHCRRKLRKG